MAEGTFEPLETELIRRELEKVDVFVDVGANLGLYCCLARSIGRKVLALEPSPENLPLLLANLNANGWDDVEIYPVAISDVASVVLLYGGGTGASLLKGWATTSQRYATPVPCLTLDSLLRGRFDGQRLFVKMDIEGAEYRALRGAQQTLERTPAPVWLVEVCKTLNHPDGENRQFAETFELFLSRGYSVYTITGQELDRTAILDGGLPEASNVNFLFKKVH